nr:MAG TPA: hypothetical protein [Caudoviricetes sp.]
MPPYSPALSQHKGGKQNRKGGIYMNELIKVDFSGATLLPCPEST